MAESEGIIERLKSENQFEWVGWMNNICNRAIEIVNQDIIYSLAISSGKGYRLLSATAILIVNFIVRPTRYNVQLSSIHIYCHIIYH